MSIALRDNLSGGVARCAQISNLQAVVGFSVAGKVKLTWTNPSDSKFKGVRIMYRTGTYPLSAEDGSIFYDSADRSVATSYEKTGFTDGIIYYFRAFAYTYKNATRLYTSTETGARITAKPLQTQGQEIITTSGEFIVPAGVTELEVFLVGGGAGSGTDFDTGMGGAGGGRTRYGKLPVTPGETLYLTVGAGGKKGTNGSTTILSNDSVMWVADGGSIAVRGVGGAGGSGGGGGGQYQIQAGNGGSDGSNGYASTAYNGGTQAFTYAGGVGQGTTTRAFEESDGTLYAGGGGGAWVPTGYPGARGFGGAGGGGNGNEYNSTTNVATGGTPNTGGGAGAHYGLAAGGDGGSGIIILRWGY